ncbi:hypothetical protein M514_00405 [Trichuris suis]|uniref:Uncharacterized protein n=1 Tax=Trichuris suis TaxID=68888 RepID=A0A085MNB6_9BILA|nr:hypothetical protein M513_00405 [Trichuris suis]KFD71993.1 hypothetical protein M514_00405 [Trichuris suis]
MGEREGGEGAKGYKAVPESGTANFRLLRSDCPTKDTCQVTYAENKERSSVEVSISKAAIKGS